MLPVVTQMRGVQQQPEVMCPYVAPSQNSEIRGSVYSVDGRTLIKTHLFFDTCSYCHEMK